MKLIKPKNASKKQTAAPEPKTTKEESSRRGRRSRNKGSNYERDVAKKFKSAYDVDMVRTPQSGGFAKKSVKADEFRGDIVPADKDVTLLLHVECKNAKTWSLPAWLKQAAEDCPKGKVPVVIFHQHNTSKDFVTLSLSDFFSLVPASAVLKVVKT